MQGLNLQPLVARGGGVKRGRGRPPKSSMPQTRQAAADVPEFETEDQDQGITQKATGRT